MLNRQPDARIVPEENQKTLTQADRDAAVVIGDQHKHFISLEEPYTGDRDPHAAQAEQDAAAAKKKADEQAVVEAAAKRAAEKPKPEPKPKAKAKAKKPTAAERADYERRLAVAKRGEDALLSAPAYGQVIRGGILDRKIRQRELQEFERTIAAYTGDTGNENVYALMNRALYAARGGQLDDGVPDRIREHITRMDRMMQLAPTKRDLVVYRGVREPHKALADPSMWDPAGGNEGLEWRGDAFSSASARDDVAQDFVTGLWGQDVGSRQGSDARFPTVYRILVPAGTRALQLTEMHSAAEILLDRGLRYRVVVDHGIVDGVHRVDLEVIP
nr:ADP-ribosyltransferase [Planomonospora venezuelensis]